MQHFISALAFFCMIQLSFAKDIVLDHSQQTDLSIDIYPPGQPALIQDRRIIGPIDIQDSVLIEDISPEILPQSLQISRAGEITEQKVLSKLSYQQLIAQNLGKRITLITHSADKEIRQQVTLLSADNNTAIIDNRGSIETISLHSEHWRLAFAKDSAKNGANEYSYPAIKFKSKGKKHTNNLLVSYLSRDIYWEMDYSLVLNTKGDKLILTGVATITNNTTTPFNRARIALSTSNKTTSIKNFQHLTLPTKTSLAPLQKTLMPIIQANDIAANSNLRFTTSINRQPNKRSEPLQPNRYLSFVNSTKNKLGVPLPAGNATLFINEQQGLKQIAQSLFQGAEAAEKTLINLGKAQDFSIVKKAVGRQDAFDGSIVSSQFILKNDANRKQTLILSTQFKHSWQVISSTYPISDKQQLSASWKITVRPKSSHVFNLKIRLKHAK